MALLSLVPFGLAGLLIFLTVTDMSRSARLRRHGVAATGEVATTELTTGQLRRRPVGTRVQIRYLPERPSFARSPGGHTLYVANLFNIAVFVGFGVLCVLAA